MEHADPMPIRLSGRLIPIISQLIGDNEPRDGVRFETPPSSGNSARVHSGTVTEARSRALPVPPTRQGVSP